MLDKAALIYGQMNEPPGARSRVALSALTCAEYFRDEMNQDVLLFVDNIFRFTQACVKRKMLSTKSNTSWFISSRKYSAQVKADSATRERAPGGSFI